MRKIIAIAICLVSSFSCHAAQSVAGRWDGVVQVPGYPMQVVVDIAQDAAGTWTGSIIIPELNIKGAALADIALHDAEISFAIKEVLADAKAGPAKFQAHVDADRSMAGTFTQAGNRAPFALTKTGVAQVDLPRHGTPVAKALEGKWAGDYELGGYPRHVTLSLNNHANAPATADFVIIGKKTNLLPVDLVVEDGGLLRVESHQTGINFEGRLRKETGELSGICEQGPTEIPLTLHRASEK